jgi:DNA gyrase subunit A
VIGATLVNESDEIMLITSGGVLVRTRVSEISIVGRNTQGVRVIRLDKKEKVVGVDRVDGLADDESDDELDDQGEVMNEQPDETESNHVEENNSGE